MSAAAEIPWTPPESKSELHPLFENAPIGLLQCQRAGNITAVNPALEQMFGGASKLARSLSLADLVHPQDRAEATRLLGELFERQRDSFQIDSPSTFGSASSSTSENVRPMRWTAWRVANTNGNPDYALVLAEETSRNLLREHEAEQRLRQADRLEAMGRLAGGVAHDFNNLLTGVLLYCDLLMAHLEPNHRVRKYAEEIRDASLQATGLVRQLLTVARPTTGEPRLIFLNDIVGSMRNLLARLIGENIELKFQLDPNLGLIRMDPTQCQQILLNLVLNARDAMCGATSEAKSGGQITVETCNCKVQVLTEQVLTEPPVGGPVLIEAVLTEPAFTEPVSRASSQAALPCALFVVTDNGSGMDEATRARVFEAFFTTKSANGTGLGLATVHEIVTSNGGLIHVDSAPSVGTRVSVLLPLVPQTVLRVQEPCDFQSEKNLEELIHEEYEEKE
jgi:two-component system cell cycle sensor histidine kinase/response regulator CckA